MTPAPRGARAILAGVPVVVGAAALFVLYAWLATRNTRVGFLADDALYLLMAEMYSPYRDALGAVYEHVRQYSHLPPLYPWLLGLAGAGPDQLQAARLANAGCMTLAWLICHGWLRARGVPWAMASALCLFCALTPATLLYVVDLWSEGLFILLVLLALGVEQALPRRPSLVALLGLGVLVACAMQTRSIGVALVPAVLLGCARRGPRAVVVTLLALGATLAAFSPLDMGSAAPSYGELMRNHYAGDPGAAIAQQLTAVARELPAALRYDLFFARGVMSWQIPIHALLLSLVARGAWLELRARSVLAVYVLGYLAIAFSWPFPEQTDRFLYPLLPLLAYALWRGSDFSGAGRAVALVAAWLPLLLACALVAPALWSTVGRALTPVPDAAFESFRTSRYWLDASRGGDTLQELARLDAHERAARLVALHVPADQCVYTMNTQMVLLHGRRPSFVPPPPARMQAGPPWSCRYFLLSGDTLRGLPAFYPLDVLRPIGKGLALVRRDERDPASPPVALLMRVK